MALTTDIISRARLDLGDMPRGFVFQGVGDKTTTLFDLGASPIDGATLVVKVGGVTQVLTTNYTVDARNGVITFLTAPANGAVITVSGTQYRYFNDVDFATFVQSAAVQHLHNRHDIYGNVITISSMPIVEEHPLSMLATTEALWALLTDSSFDIDIIAPDGIVVPRSQRYGQLTGLLSSLTAKYKEVSELLGIGMYRVETFTLRRISKATGRYIPIFVPQEIDDRRPPTRANIPIDIQGSVPNPEMLTIFNINTYQGNSWTADFDFPFPLTNQTITAYIRSYEGSALILASITAIITSAVNGVARLSLTGAQTAALPIKAVWDLMLTSTLDPTIKETYMRGAVYVERSVTNQ